MKARCVEDEATAQELCELRSNLDQAFTRVLARHGRVLIEEWVEGTPVGALEPGSALDRAEQAGALLAKLHATAPATALPAATYEWQDQARDELSRLVGERVLGASEASALGAAVEELDPRRYPAVLVHRDFCGENMLIDASGSLRVFDNERFKLEPAGFDLGRSYSRWPMSEAHWRRFCEAYRAGAPADPGPVHGWQVVVSLWSLHVRRRRDPAATKVPLEALRRLL